MRILHVVSSILKRCGGTASVVPQICLHQKRVGNDVVIATLGSVAPSDEAIAAEAEGVRILQTGYARPKWLPIPFLGGAEEMHDLLGREMQQCDIVHLHGLWMYPQWLGAWMARKRNVPYVMMPHGFLEPERLKISKWRKRLVGALIEKPNLRSADGLVATAPSEVDALRQYGLENPVHIMPIGLDLDNYGLARHNKEPAVRRRLLYFSRITPIKGLDLLAEAWARLADYHAAWELLVVGPDDRGYAAVATANFERLSPDGSVRVQGPVYGSEKFDLLQSADAFVLPTRSENWSIAVAEAMASGLPVVCTKGAPWRCLEECHGGHWVDISVDGIEQGLRNVLSLSDDARRAMGLRAREWVRENLAWNVIMRDMMAFYEEMIRGHRKA